MLISVIITTWNCDRWIGECRASVSASVDALAKANGEWKVEVIEICDGTGVANARNRALAKANGEWVVFVDGDDVISRDFFVAIAENGADADLIRFKSTKFSEGEDWFGGESVYSFPSEWQGTAFRRRILPERGFMNYRMGEDRIFFLQCMQRSKRSKKADVIVYGYRMRGDSTTHRKVTRERWLDRMASARTWLAQSGAPCVNPEEHGREIASSRWIVARDVVGVAALELQLMGGDNWRDWQANLNEAAKLGGILPLATRLQVAACRALPWRWVTRLVAELPYRALLHFGFR